MDDGTINGIADGNKVIGRRVEREYWPQGLHIRTWPYFVIVTYDDGVLVKNIAEQDLEAGLSPAVLSIPTTQTLFYIFRR